VKKTAEHKERKGKKMKALRFPLLKAAVLASLLIGLSNVALARPSVYVGIGVGRHSCSSDCRFSRSHNRPRRAWRRYRPCRETIILGGGCLYDRRSDYYVVASPRVIESVPVIVEKQTVVVQPVGFDESTIELNMKLQRRKNELLKQLQIPNKEQRMEAIRELAGFSFDDKVRCALEDVLLSDPDPELRKEAAHSFGKVKNAKALAALERARVEDANEEVRKAADEAIKSIKGN
jgi:hypothetical protein